MREIISDSLEATLKLGANISRNLRGGEVFELVSDLGGGKTAFVRGLADGIGAEDVSSPSFTISNEYRGDQLILHHFDFYRLTEPGIVAEELRESLSEQDAVVTVEWGQNVQNVLPEDRITLEITPTGESTRSLKFFVPESKVYILENVP